MIRRRHYRILLLVALALVAGIYAQFGPRSSVTENAGPASANIGWLRSVEPKTLPDIAFVTGTGRQVRLSDHRGKFVLLNIWATWCGPCVKEMPALDRLQAKRGGPAFEVMALSVDQDGLPSVKAFLERTGIRHLEIYIGAYRETLAALSVNAIPTTLLIDREGRELARTSGPRDWDDPAMLAFLDRYFGERGAGQPPP